MRIIKRFHFRTIILTWEHANPDMGDRFRVFGSREKLLCEVVLPENDYNGDVVDVGDVDFDDGDVGDGDVGDGDVGDGDGGDGDAKKWLLMKKKFP